MDQRVGLQKMREKRRRRGGSPKEEVESEIRNEGDEDEENATGSQQTNHGIQESNGTHGYQTGKTPTQVKGKG